MTKRLAAAVLCAIVNFFGSAGTSSGGGGDDDADDAGIDYVELRRDRHAPQIRSDPLVTASEIVGGGQIEHAWLLHHHSGPSAAVAVQRDASHEHAAVVSLSVDLAVLPWEELLGRSLAFCREREVLKVTIETTGAARPAAVRAAAQASGFTFVRSRHDHDHEGVDVAEFYTDLYRRDVPAQA